MLEEQIKRFLEEEEAAGLSHRKIAERHNVSHTHITHLLRGNREISRLTIETVQKMFPRATINLSGDNYELERKNLELDKENLELKKQIFELEKQIERIRKANSEVPPVPASSSLESNKEIIKTR